MSNERILVVEDDASILAGLEMNLVVEGYRVRTAMDGPSAVRAFEAEPPDLVLLDIMLPSLNGFEVLERIRAKDPVVPVLLLSAKGTEPDKVDGLNLGADDYVTKPFALKELLARINAALRRARVRRAPGDRVTFSDVSIDLDSRTVSRKGQDVPLTAREFDVLVTLARAPGRVLTRDQILLHAWGHAYEGTERTVDNFVARLREKLEANPDEPRHILTVRGVGYRFEP
ncbi:MAG: response regulator transcription factor [Deltaproteobacteria bacterium]|nr:response regulator transcription factor [Deltaproteobacteria bacterium]